MRWSNRTIAWVAAGVVLASAIGLGVALLAGLGPSKLEAQPGQAEPGKQSGAVGSGAISEQPRVKVVRPVKRESTPQPARIEPYENTDIHAKVSGYVDVIFPALDSKGKPIPDTDGKARPLDIGDRVTKDQVLAELWVPELKQDLVRKAGLVEKARSEIGQATAAVQAAQAQVEETRALLAQHDADVAYHKVEHKRFLDLLKENAVQGQVVDREEKLLRRAEAARTAAEKALLTAEQNVKVKQADEKAAEARLRVAEADKKHKEIEVDYATIRAPYDGILTRRLVDTRTFVQSATSGQAAPLFTVARVDRLRIVADIPEAEAGLVRIGQKASFLLSGAGQPLSGKVVRFAGVLDSGTRTMRTEIELDAPLATLRPGMFGSAMIGSDALTLPASALTAGAKPSLLCVGKDGRVQRLQDIEIGHNDGSYVQITRGLSADAQVIPDGRADVREGQAVTVVK